MRHTGIEAHQIWILCQIWRAGMFDRAGSSQAKPPDSLVVFSGRENLVARVIPFLGDVSPHASKCAAPSQASPNLPTQQVPTPGHTVTAWTPIRHLGDMSRFFRDSSTENGEKQKRLCPGDACMGKPAEFVSLLPSQRTSKKTV